MGRSRQVLPNPARRAEGSILGASLLSLAATAVLTTGAWAQDIELKRNGAQPSAVGAASNFTGHAVVTPLFAATSSTRASAGSVSFAPGARTMWHTHPAGQTLIVTSGSGWVQSWGGDKQQIRPGDVIWTPPGVKHWHGATATSGMSHTAVQEHVDGKVVDWLEPVTPSQYAAPEAR